MFSSRLVPPGQQTAMRKSRLETQRPSMLPKPCRPGSTDRLSSEARRPSASGHRSSSAEPPRATFGGGRLSREASATKLPLNGRSRSQQGDRFRHTSETPLRSSQFRPTITPLKSPSDRSRTWEASVERALAFVTVKDQRPISSVAWQRAVCARVGEALAARAQGGGAVLIRPLTIARFVDITAALVTAITRDTKLNTDNYVTKLPHLAKRLLYPGIVSKSWLKTVNTLHAFPHALALISYFLDLVMIIELPVSDDLLYINMTEVACLRRGFVYKCWMIFKDSDQYFEDLIKEYLQELKLLLGNDDEKIAELKQAIKKYEAQLNDEEEVAAREAEARRVAQRDALLGELRGRRAAALELRAQADERGARLRELRLAARQLELEVERASVDIQQIKVELESQTMTVEQRTKLLHDAEYAVRVQESKLTFADQIEKKVQIEEAKLPIWQKTTLDSCMQYKQELIRLSAQYPDLLSLDINENSLMSAECAAKVCGALEALRTRRGQLLQRCKESGRQRSAHVRERAARLEEVRTETAKLKIAVKSEQEALDAEISQESLEEAAAAAELQAASLRLQELEQLQQQYAALDAELRFWQHQDQLWRSKLQELQKYIVDKRLEAERLLESGRQKRVQLVVNSIESLNRDLDQ